jgi:serine/threonine-protein kinase
MAFAPGTTFAGDYRIVRLLGDGDTGALYVAEQLATGHRRALKILPAELAVDPSLRERFAQEARIGAQIPSEHVIEVIDAGIDAETGMPWLSMELLEGETLAQRMQREGPLEKRVALTVFDQLCRALEAAHALGFFHRDLAPENVLLGDPGPREMLYLVKMLDFGIAKWLLDAGAGAVPGKALHSPLWMAPEQLEAGGELSPATNVWALGLITFTMFTGLPYWRAANRRLDMRALFDEVLSAPIELASTRAGAFGREDRLPPGFDDWFARCVERDRRLRFANAAEARAAFDVVKLKMISRPDGYAQRRLPQGARTAVIAAIGVAAILAIAGIALVKSREPSPSRPPPPPTAAALPIVPSAAPPEPPTPAAPVEPPAITAAPEPPALVEPAPPPVPVEALPAAPAGSAKPKASAKPSEDSANPYR